MKKKVIGIAAGIILLAAAGGYAGVGHYYASHFFPKTAINGLNCAGLTAEQVKEEIQKHIVDYTLSITERGGKTETLSGTEIGLTYVDDHAVEKLPGVPEYSCMACILLERERKPGGGGLCL